MAFQRKPGFIEPGRGILYKINESTRQVNLQNPNGFKYDVVGENLEEITGMSRVEMPKHRLALYTSSAITPTVGDKIKTQELPFLLKVKGSTPDKRKSNALVRSSVRDQSGYIGKVIFLE